MSPTKILCYRRFSSSTSKRKEASSSSSAQDYRCNCTWICITMLLRGWFGLQCLKLIAPIKWEPKQNFLKIKVVKLTAISLLISRVRTEYATPAFNFLVPFSPQVFQNCDPKTFSFELLIFSPKNPFSGRLAGSTLDLMATQYESILNN